MSGGYTQDSTAGDANGGVTEIQIDLDDDALLESMPTGNRMPHQEDTFTAPESAERRGRSFSISKFPHVAPVRQSSEDKDKDRGEDAVVVMRRSSFGCNLLDGLNLGEDDSRAGVQPSDAQSFGDTVKNVETSDHAAQRPVLRKKRDLARVRLYEIRDNGEATMLNMSIRELYNYICKLVHRYQSPHSPDQNGVKDVSFLWSPQVSLPGGTLMKESSSKRATSPMNLRRSANQNQLHHRDLRQLFSTNAASEPVIAVRKHVVLVNLEALRSIVLVDRILLLVDIGADQILMTVERELAAEKDEVAEFELRAYETMLKISLNDLAKEVKTIEPRVGEIVNLMEMPGSHHATSANGNDKFRGLMNRVSELDSRAKARRRALLLVLEEDEDLALMNLTKMKDNPALYKMPLAPEVAEDHEEIELLLECYLQEINSLSNVLEMMKERMRNTESLIMVKLDIARNRLLTASTIFALIAMCLSLGAVVTGMFGTNLNSGVQESPHWFNAVAITLVIVCPGWALLTYAYFSWKGVWVS